jgi:hypothetical protein
MKPVSYCMLAVFGVVTGCGAAGGSGDAGDGYSNPAKLNNNDASLGQSSGSGSGSGGSGDDSTTSSGGGEDAPTSTGEAGDNADALAAVDAATEDGATTLESGASPDGSAVAACASSCSGCCDSMGNCNTDGTQSIACGTGGALCEDCTSVTGICTGGTCGPGPMTDAGAPSDGGPNACTPKGCFDWFDCAFQGCFNGCSGFFGHCM